MTYQPPFSLTDKVVSLIAEIAQKVGRVEVYERLDRNPQLRKENRIKTIHSSLAIEDNKLSLEQATAVVKGKHVAAPPKDLLEAQNAVTAYDALEAFDPYSVEDLPRAHRMLMGGLVRENSSMTIAQMAQVIGVSKRQMERIVAKFKTEGKLVRTGSRRNGRWEVRND